MILEIPNSRCSLECQTTYLDDKRIMLNKIREILHKNLLGDSNSKIEVILKTQTQNEVSYFGRNETFFWIPANKTLEQKYPSLF